METLTPLLFVALVSLVVEVLKRVEQAMLGFNERVKDVFYAVLVGVAVAIFKFLGVIDLDWSVVLPLLFAPQGLFVVVKKLLGK